MRSLKQNYNKNTDNQNISRCGKNISLYIAMYALFNCIVLVIELCKNCNILEICKVHKQTLKRLQ